MTAQTILPANTLSSGGYDVANSCRFGNPDTSNSDTATDYLLRTYSAGNRRTFTISFWVKRSNLNIDDSFQQVIGQQASDYFRVGFGSNEQGNIFRAYGRGGFEFRTKVFIRDVTAWYHFVLTIDTTQGTASNRAKLYINGVRQTEFFTENYPDQNTELDYNRGARHTIGKTGGTNGIDAFCGYLAEFVSIDGTAYQADSFGEFDTDSPTVWKPIDVSGLTFGSQGFYLDFADGGDLGDDESGNGNDWAETGIDATNQGTDTCTNNFATMNPLYKSVVALSEGNLLAVENSSEFDSVLSTIGVSSGRWYVEFKVIALAGSIMRNYFGICDARDGNAFAIGSIGADESGRVGDTVAIEKAAVNKNGSSQYSVTNNAANDIFGVYLDLDNGAVYFSKNGSLLNSGNPASGASKTGAVTITTGETYLFGMTAYNSSCSVNFGSPHIALSSANADANGYGSFEYSPTVSGVDYYTLNTKNLAEYG